MHEVFREIKENVILEKRERLDFPAHIHEDIELVYIKKGGGTAFCDGKKYILTDNSFFLVFPNQVHRYDECAEGEYLLLIVKPTDLLSYSDVFMNGTLVSALWQFEEKGDNGIVSLMEIAAMEYNEYGFSTVVGAYLTALFGKLFRFYEIEKNSEKCNTVLQILQYCKAHYKEDITVESVAKDLHLSKSSVSHIFSKRLSMNFCNYVNSLRLADAVELLKNKNSSMTEISDAAGFPTIRTFNRSFRKQYGVSPSGYKKQLMGESR